MCNCILWVRRRLLALLLIIGCMAVSATASATVCFLPDAEDCGLSSASDGNSVCDGSTTYASVTDCNNSITLNNNSQYCEKDGACYRRYCKYPTQSDCEAGVKDYTHKYDHFFCVYDSSTSCYDLQNTPCIEKTTKTGCDGYKLDAPTEGKTCGSCSQRVVTETCSAEGLPGETDEYKTVYDCVEPKYQQIGCDSFDKTETEKDTLEAAPNNYHCTSCTKTNQKQDYEGHWNDYGKGDTMYKCTPTCATYGLVTSCSQGSGEAGTIAFVEDTKGRTNYDGKKCGTCGCTPKPCTGYDYTEDTLSDKSNNVETCNPGCDQPTKYKCKKGYAYDSKSKSCKVKDQNYGKTYYVTVYENITFGIYGSDKNCSLLINGKIKYPNTKGDTFMDDVYFGAKLAGYADYKDEGSDGEDRYTDSEKTYTKSMQNSLSGSNSEAVYDVKGGTPSAIGSPLPCLYQDLYFSENKVYISRNGSKYWVGFEQGSNLYTSNNEIEKNYSGGDRCKTISKNGSSRTICIKYETTNNQNKTVTFAFATNCPKATHSNMFGVIITAPDGQKYTIGECTSSQTGDTSYCKSSISDSIKLPYQQTGSYNLQFGCVGMCGGRIYNAAIYMSSYNGLISNTLLNDAISENSYSFAPTAEMTYKVIADCEQVEIDTCTGGNVYMASGSKQSEYCAMAQIICPDHYQSYTMCTK